MLCICGHLSRIECCSFENMRFIVVMSVDVRSGAASLGVVRHVAVAREVDIHAVGGFPASTILNRSSLRTNRGSGANS